MSTLLILDIRRIADTCDRKSHTENASALLERFRFVHVMRDISEHKKTEELVLQRLKFRDTSLIYSVDELMQETIDVCELLTDSKVGFFHLVDDDQQNLTLQAWSSNTLTVMCTVEGKGSHYPISEAGVWTECFHSREPVIHNDYAAIPNRKGMPVGHAPVLRELTVPVVMNDKVVSIIGVGNKTSPYTEHDVYVVKQFVTFAYEVIERKKAIVALQESEEKHRKLANEQQIILNSTSVGICFVKERKVIWANPAFDRIFGYEPGASFNKDTAELYVDIASYKKIGEEAYSAIMSGVVYSQDILMKKRDGSLVWCNLAGQAISPGDLEEGSIWIFQDITERKRGEKERLKLEQQFQQTQKLESLGVLAGGIAHDFNNILTIILGHCFMVKEDFDSGMTDKEHVQMIESAGNRAADLCRQMLAYAGQSPQVQTKVNLWLLVDEVVKMLKSAIKKNVSIQLDLKRDVPELTGDSAQIQQVVMNLIINAAEAIGDKNGTIRVVLNNAAIQAGQSVADFMGNAILPGRYACLEISDTGCGIDEDTQKRIFEPFFTTKFTGRGLGMSAVLGIVKSHDGALQLTSSPGVGSTFTVYFPLPAMADAIDTAQSVVAEIASPANATILLVDDEESLRTIGSALLNAIGFSVMTAANGREALGIYRERGSEIDLVLLDLMMPEMSGIETYHEIRNISRDIPIIICSGYGAESATDITATDDKTSFLNKPYNPAELRRVLNERLGGNG